MGNRTWYDGKQVTKESLLEELSAWHGSGEISNKKALLFISKCDYKGKDDDLEYIVKKLNTDPAFSGEVNLQDVDSVLYAGEWYFQEDERFSSFMEILGVI